MKLINLLIRELDNCKLGGDFESRAMPNICQFDRFSLEINFKRARSCNYGIPRLGSSSNENTVLASVSFWLLLIIELLK